MSVFENNREALKITDKTLFLLGNGCSMEYGFPAGEKLLLECFNLIQQYRYLPNYFVHNLYTKLFYFLSHLSDLHEMMMVGNIDALHFPYYSNILKLACDRGLCSNRRNRLHYYSDALSCLNCADSKIGGIEEMTFEESDNRHIFCKAMKDILKDLKVWELFSELSTKYRDKKTYGQGSLQWKRNNIRSAYDGLAKLLVDILFFYYEHKNTCNSFFEFINNLQGFQGIIVDLNYDLLLEEASPSNKLFKVLKPHGSFDLLYYSGKPYSHWKAVPTSWQNVHKLTTQKNIFEFMTGHYLADAIPLNVAYADITTHLRISTTNQSKFIKEYTKPIIKELKKDINKYDKIVTIGYSFSETWNKKGLIDKHIIEPLLSKKIYVVGKGNTKDIVDRVKKYHQKAQILPTDFDGFGNYARQIKYQK
jgi:hypothetical protein